MSPIIFLWGPSESSHGVYGKVLDKISFLMSSNCYLWFFNVSRSCEYKYALIRLWCTFLYVCICIIHMCVCVCDYLCVCQSFPQRCPFHDCIPQETPRRSTAGGGKIKSDGLTSSLRKTLCATDNPFEGDEDFGGFVSGFPFKKGNRDLRSRRSEKKQLSFSFKDGLFGWK